MDPLYKPFFKHVLAICWPWLWWNLVRLTAWRLRTGRDVFVTVDRFGNVRVRYVGDAPKPKDAYAYVRLAIARWARTSAVSDLPETLVADVACGSSCAVMRRCAAYGNTSESACIVPACRDPPAAPFRPIQA